MGLAQRRLAQGLSAARAVIGQSSRRGTVFHHIPKCAGTSVGDAFRRYYAPWRLRVVPHDASVRTGCLFANGAATATPAALDLDDPRWLDVHAHRLRLLHTFLTEGALAVSGHVIYHPIVHEQFRDSHCFVTILRDPIERFVSQYFYNKSVNSYARLPDQFGDADLERIGPAWGSMLTFFLGGGESVGRLEREPDMGKLVTEAKKAVEALNIVGFVDRMEMLRRDIANKIGIQIVVRRRNVGPSRRERSAEEEWVREAAKRFCEPDLEVYAHARALRAGGRD